MVNFNVKYKYVEGEFDIQYIDIWLMLQLNMERLKFAGKQFFLVLLDTSIRIYA